MQKADDHIGHLHAGVVDVVLHIDLLPGGAQQAHKRVAQDGVAQVPDVRSLVGIDAGVLDQRVNTRAEASILLRLRNAVSAAPRSSRALMYPAPATSKPAKPSSGWQFSDSSSSAQSPWATSQRARQLKGDRGGVLAHLRPAAAAPD